MTTGEILVIAAAAAVFIIINVLMWSIIIRKERAEAAKQKPKPQAQPFRTEAPKAEPVHDDSIRLPGSVPASAGEMGFRLLENTVIIHTNERI